jgi:hypothetical protein
VLKMLREIKVTAFRMEWLRILVKITTKSNRGLTTSKIGLTTQCNML